MPQLSIQPAFDITQDADLSTHKAVELKRFVETTGAKISNLISGDHPQMIVSGTQEMIHHLTVELTSSRDWITADIESVDQTFDMVIADGITLD